MKRFVKYFSVGILFAVATLITIGLFVETTKIFFIIAAILSGGLALGMIVYHFVTIKQK